MIEKPWGAYEVLLDEEQYRVKRLTIKQGEKTSLQSHEHREEHWIIVHGEGTILLGDAENTVEYGEHIHVETEQKHRIQNDGEDDLVLIEVWTGEAMDENDIERFADAYGRID